VFKSGLNECKERNRAPADRPSRPAFGRPAHALTGDAAYLGPTFFWKIAPKALMSAAREAQVGRPRDRR
jgi:hypothetical protein